MALSPRITRLSTVVAALLLAATLAAEGQQAGKVHRIGVVSTGSPAASAHLIAAFREALRDHGYVDGQNLVLDVRFAEGRADRMRAFASDLVRLKVDVVVTVGEVAARAAQKASPTAPLVFAFVGDPVAAGLVKSMARPGGNATGLTNLNIELSAKRVALFREAVPAIRHVAVLGSAATPEGAAVIRETQKAAEALGLTVRVVDVKTADDLERALQAITSFKPDALFVTPSGIPWTYRAKVLAAAQRGRLPTFGWVREWAEEGALLSYGVSNAGVYRKAAQYVAKILNGAKPSDLPVEQPTRLELVINLKTAKALALTIPPTLLLQADHVIER